VKSDLRRVAALEQALVPTLDSINAQDAAGYFRHCGYGCLNYIVVCYWLIRSGVW
jgi:hypothetical protein